MSGNNKAKVFRISEKNKAIVFSAMAESGYPEAKDVASLSRSLRGDEPLWGIVKNIKGSTGRTSLMHAALIGDMPRFTFLLERAADVSKRDDAGITLLHYAVLGGNLNIIRQVINMFREKGLSIDQEDRDRRTPLMCAAEKGNIEAFNILLSEGAVIQITSLEKYNIISYAAIGGNPDIIRIILQTVPVDTRSGIDDDPDNYDGMPSPGFTPLAAACMYKQFEAVKILCEYGADVNAICVFNKTPICFSSLYMEGDEEYYSAEEKKMHEFTNVNKSIITYLLTQNANINHLDRNGLSSLMYAAKHGDLERFTFLLNSGANPTQEDTTFRSVLYWAAVGGNLDIITLLLESGVQLNHKNENGNTALHYAAAYGDVGAVKVLLKAGVNVNEINNSGSTALMSTLVPSLIPVRPKPSQETKAEIVEILLKAGSDITMGDRYNLTPLHLACNAVNVEAVRILCDAGADVNALGVDRSTPIMNLITHSQYYKGPSENVEEIFEILLSYHANIDIQDDGGRTLESLIHEFIDRDEELKQSLLGRIASLKNAAGPVGGGGGRLGGGGGAGTQGGGSRRGKGRTRGKGKKGKGKGKGKTRKARS